MCTVVLLSNPAGECPLLLAANRDEWLGRPWDPPARHWPDQPDVLAGRDRTAGGTWLGLNDAGVVAAVLNRSNSLGPAPGKLSRGMLPLLALRQRTAAAAAAAIGALDGSAWRPFNLVLADRSGAFFLRGTAVATIDVVPLASGLHMATALDIDDPGSPRTQRYLPRFAATPWSDWGVLLADRGGAPEEQINVTPRDGFGTGCASLIALGPTTSFRFAAGPPDRAAFAPVDTRPHSAGHSADPASARAAAGGMRR